MEQSPEASGTMWQDALAAARALSAEQQQSVTPINVTASSTEFVQQLIVRHNLGQNDLARQQNSSPRGRRG